MTAPAARDGLRGSVGRDFRRLWAAQAVSLFGSLVTRAALPFYAALALHASPAQMAMLAGAGLLAGLAVTPWAGTWLDRRRRRPVMIACDLARAVLLAAIPVAAFAGVLRFEWLLVVQFGNGALTTLFDLAQSAYLPSLVGEAALVGANSRLTATSSVAEVSAFGLAGWLVQWLGGPIAVAMDAVSFLVSAVFLGGLRRSERDPGVSGTGGESFWRESLAGLRAAFGDPVQRALAFADAGVHLTFGLFMACYTLFCTRDLGLPTGPLGMVYALGGLSALAGAIVAPRFASRPGRAMVLGLCLGGAGLALAGLAPAARHGAALVTLALQQLLGDGGMALFMIHSSSARMALAPERMRGRIGAGARLLGLLAMLVGVAAAGVLGGTVSLRVILLAAGGIMALSAAFLASPRLHAAISRELHALHEATES